MSLLYTYSEILSWYILLNSFGSWGFSSKNWLRNGSGIPRVMIIKMGLVTQYLSHSEAVSRVVWLSPALGSRPAKYQSWPDLKCILTSELNSNKHLLDTSGVPKPVQEGMASTSTSNAWSSCG